MKTKILAIFVLGLLTLTPVLALPSSVQKLKIHIRKYETLVEGQLKTFVGGNFRLGLVQKNPTDWSVIEDGAYCRVEGKAGYYLTATCSGLEPRTEYTLIYYGDETHNDVWPYATCLKQGKSGRSYGGSPSRLRLKNIHWSYSNFLDDGVGQKLWLVKSSDVDCNQGKMTAWNPTEYLFEWDVI